MSATAIPAEVGAVLAAMTQPALTCQVLQVRQAHGLGGADPAGLDGGVLAVQHVDVLGWWLPGTPAIPASGMFVSAMEYLQPAFFS
jgi:hypothetical protein